MWDAIQKKRDRRQHTSGRLTLSTSPEESTAKQKSTTDGTETADMSKRVRTTKADSSDGDSALAVAAAPRGLSTTRPRASSASGATSMNGKGKGIASGAAETTNGSGSDTQANKHVMLPAFLSKTFEIFSMPEFATICGWNASGDTIIVSQLEAFVAMVLPRFFKHRNFPSFVRQLNLYGFHKTVLDSKRLEFQHPYFKRDRPDLLHMIKRKVSSGSTTTQQQSQTTRLEVHREISDQLLKEMKELRQRSDGMEKRLRELEIDNAIVRSDNLKLWKHLEAAKDKQLIMQEKMKKIMWILFQIYRGKQGLPKIGSHGQDEVISDDSLLGPKEFRDVLRFLAMDEPPLLPRSTSTGAVGDAGLTSRKRKFVEVPPDSFDSTLGDNFFQIAPSSVVEVATPARDPLGAASSFAPQLANASTTHSDGPNNVLSIFSPQYPVPRIPPSIDTAANGSTEGLHSTALVSPTASHAAGSATTDLTTTSDALTTAPSTDDTTEALDLIDDDLALLSDHDNYTFGDGEEHVMKKLEDFETSLLKEYDVGCLDSLLQQLKTVNNEKTPLALPALDPEEILNKKAKTSGEDNSSTGYAYVRWSEVKNVLNYERYKQMRKPIPDHTFQFLVEYLKFAADAMNGYTDASREAKRYHFIAPVLVVLCSLFDDVKLEVEETVDGDVIHANGHFQFILTRGKTKICIVEAKKNDFDQGRAQALVGCEAVADREGLHVVYGIVTDFMKWHLYRSGENSILMDSSTLSAKSDELDPDSMRDVCEMIYGALLDDDEECKKEKLIWGK
ncbi:hypothetical protein Poli38472_005748 [Pythium oligandrum]|uniref:HSF-type DNA-binding domain-containing protein n=1 Tax=Pythium oligandrum TaxID=41045 RepID=A0A8K1FLI2_PYTOL|nr:hypothetical protein Poli38472_005748 [Pythium oligandrum]|eukprot:TMW68280.1 hypothetical protein Poli38472_005748 [Pythium oligandrum]